MRPPRAERARRLLMAEQPVVADLRALGLELDTVWDLYTIPDSRPQAFPLLLKTWPSTTRTLYLRA
jgi:hypothetical protein